MVCFVKLAVIGQSDKIPLRINFPSVPRQLEETMVRRFLVEYSMKLLFHFCFSSNKQFDSSNKIQFQLI